ncbi:DNA ligase (ATP) [Dissophora globulifera]|uniref:DNA ligase n=1 Tax=Dissophora globulifera TaxID=979702 RepID=A0A9P6UZS4_9FUNG|nr:DNA ligase (ATP) [Dissophora globulifera]
MSDSASDSPIDAPPSSTSKEVATGSVLHDDDPSIPSPPFHDLIMLLEDISRRRTEKTQLIRKYFKEWRENGYGSMYHVIRLLLPQLDRERGRYGLKEQKMADLYINALNILPGSEPALKLKSWKEGLRDSAGDFSLVVREVVASRSLVTHPQGQTIRDVNEILTKLSRKGSDNPQIFKTLVQTYTALENKWIVRIVNKDLKIGMSENSVLPCYHQDAIELFNVCSDLRKTVIDCADPHIRITTTAVNLMQAFKPMLSKRVPNAKEVIECMGHMPFWIETKLDGERVQVHKDGENYRYWSRNSTEYTHLYGATPNEGSLTPFLHTLINPKVEKLILDGEMVEYDPVTKEIINFGTVKTAGGDHSDDQHRRRPCIFIFDVLYMNGASIIDQALETRREMLPSVIPKESEGRVQILPYQVSTTEQHIIDAIDAAVMGRQEGVIVKNPKSAYTPNGRGQEWIKIKPEYIDGVCDSLDVLVVGGYYGSGARGGQGSISSYLCAVRDNTSKSHTGKKFLSFCRFGSGFTYEQMGKFNQILGPHWKEYKYYRENPWVDIIDNAKMRPDVIIDPEKSIVVEVKASEIVPNSDSYAADYTLRFPRFLHIREDKDCNSCMTMSEVHRMFREFKGKLSSRQIDTSGTSGETKAKKKLTRPRKTTQPHLLHAMIGDMSAVKMEADLFKGQVFWVVRGDDQQSKPDLEVMVKRYGGKQSQSDQMEGTIIIAGHQGPDLIGLKKKGLRNIVLPTWIRDCVSELRLIPLNPKYMLFTTEETKRQFRLIMDDFDDSYHEPLTIGGLQEILDKMPNRSEVIKRRRIKVAHDRAAKIKIKRLNNLEDQIHTTSTLSPLDASTTAVRDSDSNEGDNDAGMEMDMDLDKDMILQMELDNPDGGWEKQDAERARKIAAALTRRYYGNEGEKAPPLGMFQGVKVFIVYPPTPEEYLRSLVALETEKVKQEEEHGSDDLSHHYQQRDDEYMQKMRKLVLTTGSKDPGRSCAEVSIFDSMAKAYDLWAVRRDKGFVKLMDKLDTKSHGSIRSSQSPNWQFVDEEAKVLEDLTSTLSKLSHYEVCRNDLDMISQTLEFHGAQVVPQERCTIRQCQQLLRNRVNRRRQDTDQNKTGDKGRERKKNKEEQDEEDVGVPIEVVVLFDPLYLDPLEQWKEAMRVSALYGANAQSFEVPRLVTSEWVRQSHKSGYRLPEEGYYPSA